MGRHYYLNNLEVKGYALFRDFENLQGHSYLVHRDLPLLHSILDMSEQAGKTADMEKLAGQFGRAAPYVYSEGTAMACRSSEYPLYR